MTVFAIGLPTIYANILRQDEEWEHMVQVSRWSSIFLLFTYCAYLYFQLGTHRSLFESPEEDEEEEEEKEEKEERPRWRMAARRRRIEARPKGTTASPSAPPGASSSSSGTGPGAVRCSQWRHPSWRYAPMRAAETLLWICWPRPRRRPCRPSSKCGRIRSIPAPSVARA
mmetsp:Transcript_104516/g.300461  ORF Transcript_104516/g.300461 Transcript_104516/m.300461 type:complete len:170 (-) Transcript_104516:1065-1574(-)